MNRRSAQVVIRRRTFCGGDLVLLGDDYHVGLNATQKPPSTLIVQIRVTTADEFRLCRNSQVVQSIDQQLCCQLGREIVVRRITDGAESSEPGEFDNRRVREIRMCDWFGHGASSCLTLRVTHRYVMCDSTRRKPNRGIRWVEPCLFEQTAAWQLWSLAGPSSFYRCHANASRKDCRELSPLPMRGTGSVRRNLIHRDPLVRRSRTPVLRQ